MSEQVLEQTVSDEAPAQEAPISIAEHAAQFGPGADRESDLGEDDGGESDPPLRMPHPSDQQRRDQGKFTEGKRRMRAKDAVSRIGELTGRAKSAEERAQALEAELQALRNGGPRPQAAPGALPAQTQAPARQEPQRTAPAAQDAEPKEDDPSFDGDYGKYLSAHARWAARDEYRKQRAAEQLAAQRTEKTQAMHKRLEVAREKYPDFDPTVNAAFQRVPQGSAIEAWIFQHKLGDDVLYYFGKQPQELDAILRLPTALEQFEAVTLLSQRFASSPSGQAGTTRAAAGRNPVVLPPKPPTLVRTEAQRVSDGPPPTDGSLSIAEHLKAFGPAKRSR